jgi:hypothetical protein
MVSRSYSSTETTTTTLRPCFSISTGSARAVSIISPNAFFASRADIVFMADFRGDPVRHLGRNSSFEQRRICGFDPGGMGVV